MDLKTIGVKNCGVLEIFIILRDSVLQHDSSLFYDFCESISCKKLDFKCACNADDVNL